MKFIESNNEWDPLQKIIVGRIDNSCTPPDEPSYRIKSNGESIIHGFSGKNNQTKIDKANGEINNFIKTLENEDIQVYRPDIMEFNQSITTPDFTIPHMNANSCPRDIFSILNNEVLESNMSWRSRYFEYLGYRPLLNKFFGNDPNMKWTCMPKCSMNGNMYIQDYPVKRDDPKRIELCNNQVFPVINEPVLDAADIVRCGKDLFIQHGYLTNQLGINWVKRQYGDRYNIHQVNFENNIIPTHMDALMVPIRPGTMLYNSWTPIISNEVLELFKNSDWDLIAAPKPNTMEMPNKCTSSPSLNINMLSLNEDTIIVEESERDTIKFLEEEIGMNVIKLPFRNAYCFGGSFHCYTCDIHRNGRLQSYFI